MTVEAHQADSFPPRITPVYPAHTGGGTAPNGLERGFQLIEGVGRVSVNLKDDAEGVHAPRFEHVFILRDVDPSDGPAVVPRLLIGERMQNRSTYGHVFSRSDLVQVAHRDLGFARNTRALNAYPHELSNGFVEYLGQVFEVGDQAVRDFYQHIADLKECIGR